MQGRNMINKELTPVEIRLATARTWKKRVDGLLKNRRKKDPDYSEAQFCEAHSFDPGFFNRIKNIRVVPTQKTVDSVEKALKKEGV
jgi:hypothetical protein